MVSDNFCYIYVLMFEGRMVNKMYKIDNGDALVIPNSVGSMEHTWGTPAMNRFYQHTQVCVPLTPWGRVLLENLTDPQLVKKFLTFSGSRKFISTFTRACQLPICGGAHYYSLYLPPLLRDLSQQKNSVSDLSKEVCIKCTEPVS